MDSESGRLAAGIDDDDDLKEMIGAPNKPPFVFTSLRFYLITSLFLFSLHCALN